MRILAVDDDPTILEITELFLESIGYTNVRLAPSAQHAMREMDAAKHPFDCVLLDINMPGMSGIELIPEIIGHPRHHGARIVMLSALSDTQHIADAFVAGAIDYMLKPFELFDLEASIQAVETQRLAQRPVPVTALNYDRDQVVQISRLIERGATLRSDGSGIVSPFAIENCIRRVPLSTRESAAVMLLEVEELPTGDDAEGLPLDHPFIGYLSDRLVQRIAGGRKILSYNGDGIFTILAFSFTKADMAALDAAVATAMQEADRKLFAGSKNATSYRTRLVFCRDLASGASPLDTLRDAREGDPMARAIAFEGPSDMLRNS